MCIFTIHFFSSLWGEGVVEEEKSEVFDTKPHGKLK